MKPRKGTQSTARNSGTNSIVRDCKLRRVGGLFDNKDYTGDVTPMLRSMALVINSLLKRGHTFPDCNLVALRIAEEANFRGISFQMDKSDELKLYCLGPESFLVYATNINYGLTVTKCNVLEESVEHTVGSPISIPHNVTPSISRSPYNVKMIVPFSLLNNCRDTNGIKQGSLADSRAVW